MQNGRFEASLRRAQQEAIHNLAGQKGPGLPLALDDKGRPIGLLAVTVALNRPVLATLEEMIRRVVREEIAAARTELSGVDE